MPKFSAIIVNYNSARSIASCLNSIVAYGRSVELSDILVLDNASTDETRTIVSSKYPQVRLIEQRVNLGFGKGVNCLAEIARGEVYLILNPDCVVQTNCLRYLDEAFARFPDAALIGCQLVDEEGRKQPSSWNLPTLHSIFLEAMLPYKTSLNFVTRSRSAFDEVPMISGAAMAIRSTIFHALGGFDERFFLYFEDADLCKRARDQHYPIYILPQSIVFHSARKSFGSDLSTFFLHFYISKILYMKKHYPSWYSQLAKLVILFGISLRIPAYFLVGKLFRNRELLRLAKYHTFVLPRILKA